VFLHPVLIAHPQWVERLQPNREIPECILRRLALYRTIKYQKYTANISNSKCVSFIVFPLCTYLLHTWQPRRCMAKACSVLFNASKASLKRLLRSMNGGSGRRIASSAIVLSRTAFSITSRSFDPIAHLSTVIVHSLSKGIEASLSGCCISFISCTLTTLIHTPDIPATRSHEDWSKPRRIGRGRAPPLRDKRGGNCVDRCPNRQRGSRNSSEKIGESDLPPEN
jgi:hypothetical protein